jgi:hypothetical protein
MAVHRYKTIYSTFETGKRHKVVKSFKKPRQVKQTQNTSDSEGPTQLFTRPYSEGTYVVQRSDSDGTKTELDLDEFC